MIDGHFNKLLISDCLIFKMLFHFESYNLKRSAAAGPILGLPAVESSHRELLSCRKRFSGKREGIYSATKDHNT